jgi:glycosidase
MTRLSLRLSLLEQSSPRPQVPAQDEAPERAFHITRQLREAYGLEHTLFSLRGNVVLMDFRQVRELTAKLNARLDSSRPEQLITAGQLNAMGLIDEILHYVVALYRQQIQRDVFDTALVRFASRLGEENTQGLLHTFGELFPPQQVYAGKTTVAAYLQGFEGRESCRSLALEELLLLALANLNPGFRPFRFLFDETSLAQRTVYTQAMEELREYFAGLPPFGPQGMNLWDLLRAPALASPDSLLSQLEYMHTHWGLLIGRAFSSRLFMGLDLIQEEEKPRFFGPGPTQVYTYTGQDAEYERFSQDLDWMPRTVLMAKSTLVWLYQLSQKYKRSITRLDQIPDEELDELARRGFTALWLIGLWERSNASKIIKQWTGNHEAAASAYSLYDYDIAGELGGWDSLINLRERCMRRGIRLGSDMVPNHTGIDSRWIIEHPDRFLQLPYPPFPDYRYTCGNLSGRDDITIQIEEHYFTRTDAAVVFKRIDNTTGEVRYIYHGNDGTSMPWNDTAQIDFLNPDAREAVIQTIIGVCKQFAIVRFDAAMTLAKRHIQRLWYPEPGRGGDIASRAEHALSAEEFNRRIPQEFWREVVDRCAVEAPHTLLLAEAFWMMEGYFVRTLGMHRVYNSAFMNMLKNEENAKYRATIKNTLEFDPEILKRFVNFLNNPDEETAVAQFGKGDKYFGICTLLVTMPGLPMFGHGQIEGFEEKYGMEYRRAYREETPDPCLVDRHEQEIFPLMRRRLLFSGSADFCLYDLYTSQGSVDEHVFAYSNRLGQDRALVFYNNSYHQSSGWIRQSAVAIPQKDGTFRQDSLAQALGLHSHEQRFVFFFEQRSSRWYLRSSREIADRGFFVALKGYETQVFLDIHEKEDPRGRWARLWADLQGRGVADPQGALQDLFLGELYASFMELFKPRCIAALDRAFGEEAEEMQEKERLDFIASLKEPVLAFIRTALRYKMGAEGRYDPFPSMIQTQEPEPSPEVLALDFTEYLKRLFRLAAYARPLPGSRQTQPEDPLHTWAAGVLAKPFAGVFALGYGVFALLPGIIGPGACGADAAALIRHWDLERKVQEAWALAGIPYGTACRLTALARALLIWTRPKDPGLYGSPFSPAALLRAHAHDEDFRRLLGINRFEGIIWFNKEAFEETVDYASLFLALESEAAFVKPADPFPEITPFTLGVLTAYAGADPKAVESSVTRVLEGALSKVSPLEKIASSSSRGSSIIRLEFSPGTDLEQASEAVREALEQVRNDMPPAAESPKILYAEDFRRLLGTNPREDGKKTRQSNRDVSWRTRLHAIALLAEQLRKAEEASGYELDRLIDRLKDQVEKRGV